MNCIVISLNTVLMLCHDVVSREQHHLMHFNKVTDRGVLLSSSDRQIPGQTSN